MTRLFAATWMVLMMANGCAVAPEAERGDNAATGVATSELTSPQICFTCELDPSVHSCSSISNRAQFLCERACIVCDEFGDNIGECFRGPCEPDAP